MIRGLYPKVVGALAALSIAVALGACGQKGPLKMPEPPKPAEPAK